MFLPHQIVGQQLNKRFDQDVRRHFFRRMEFAGPVGDPGWFGPDSAVWHVHSHMHSLVFGLQCAAYIERLDPSIYWMGVHHSRLVKKDSRDAPMPVIDPKGAAVRLGHSVAFFIGTAYGSTPTAERLATAVRSMHHTVKGTRPDGARYDADDPDWLRWNYATVVRGIATAHQLYHPQPLRGNDIDRYYGEFVRVGHALGGTDLPSTKQETLDCLESYLPRLAVTYGTAMATGPNLPLPQSALNWAIRDTMPRRTPCRPTSRAAIRCGPAPNSRMRSPDRHTPRSAGTDCDRVHSFFHRPADSETLQPMSTTRKTKQTQHREVAKLDRVPLPVEAARVGVTGWQVTRTGARVVGKLAGRGSLQQKVVKQIPQAFADLGPTYVKFGQIIASSPGAFGEPLSREFRSLLDRVPPADSDAVHKLFQEDLGDEPANLFKSFDEKPFASASIAQVHYATLHTGEEVVVKIQRPGIRRRVAADLQILKRGARLVEFAKLGQRLSAQDVVADFADNLAEELDFRLEAQSMDAWVAHMHASPLGKNIRVPQVYWDLTSERVLTMERVTGVRIDDVAAIRKKGFDGTELVKALLFSLFEGGLRHGLFHGDLHAGNLYVDDDGKIVFFDFGIMGRIDPRTRWLLRELVHALLVKKDHATAGKIVVMMGAVGTVKPEAQAAKDLEKFATPLTATSLGDLSYAEIGKQLSALAEAYDVKLPRELVLIGKQFLYVERYMKLLAPRWQMMSDPQLTGYFANFMVEISREHKENDLEA